jgi:hypothetical protein
MELKHGTFPHLFFSKKKSKEETDLAIEGG